MGNIQEIETDFFNSSFIMQVNLMHAHCFDSFQKRIYIMKTDPKIQIILWLNTFSPSNCSILERSGVYSLYLLSFLTIC